MSDDGQDVCIFTTIGLWPTTAGAARVLAAVAPTAMAPPFSSLRRERLLFSVVSFTASSLRIVYPLLPCRAQCARTSYVRFTMFRGVDRGRSAETGRRVV